MVWLVIWVVLMMFWLFFGAYTIYTPAAGGQPVQPALVVNTLIPWLCVLIIGLVVFGALSPGRWPQ